VNLLWRFGLARAMMVFSGTGAITNSVSSGFK
jgi:hypothetical protein